jgi:hypothetical protein
MMEGIWLHRIWIRKRAVSTMVAGIIVLSIFLMADAAMVLVGQQYHAYLLTNYQMRQNEIDRVSESLVPVYPGLDKTVSSPSGTTQYVLTMSNYAGIATRIRRIYVSSSISPGCYPNPCVLDPSATAVPNSFRALDALVNGGEFGHQVTVWLSSANQLESGTSTVQVATSRGRVFSFVFPFPQNTKTTGGIGGTGLNIGPLVIMYQAVMITYSVGNSAVDYQSPVDTGWVFPYTTNIMFFIKIANQGLNNVILSAQSSFQVNQFDSTGDPDTFWLAMPMDTDLCTSVFRTNSFDPTTYCGPGGAYPDGNKVPGSMKAYSSAQPYNFLPPLQPGVCCGPPIYVVFAAGGKSPGQSSSQQFRYNNKAGAAAYYTYLNLVFQYDDGTGVYTYALNLPFIVFCGAKNVPTGSYASNCPLSEI